MSGPGGAAGAAGRAFAERAQRYMPDPFVLALLLTLVAWLAAMVLTDTAPGALFSRWAAGLWGFLAFAMQMALILVTGHALASAPAVARVVERLTAWPSTAAGAVGLTAATACLAGLVNWGLGLIVGAYLAREMGRRAEARGLAVHYPLLGAAGYLGMLVWHGGLSGSAPLLMATPGREILPEVGVIPVQETLLSPLNLVATFGAVAVAVGVVRAMSPPSGEAIPFSSFQPEAAAPEPPTAPPRSDAREGWAWAAGLVLAAAVVVAVVAANLRAGRAVSWLIAALDLALLAAVGRGAVLALARRGGWERSAGWLASLAAAAIVGRAIRPLGVWAAVLAAVATTAAGGWLIRRRGPGGAPAGAWDASRALAGLFGLAGLGWVQAHFAGSGFGLDLDLMILLFLSLGLLARGSPVAYARAVTQAAPAAAGIVLQFPFYAGLLAVMQGAGLLGLLSEGMVAAGGARAFPLLAMLSAAVVNVFVPSGGGQWAVQGPIVVEAAQVLAVPLPKAILAVAYGDQLTNMLQPFWALPLLGITGLNARDVVGYTTVVMLAAGAVYAGALLLF